MSREKTTEIQQAALKLISTNTPSVAAQLAASHGITRQAANYHLKALQESGQITATGKGRNKRYQIAAQKKGAWTWPLCEVEEDRVWREFVYPLLADLPASVRDIWHYGFTEMVNNAVDHSEGKKLSVVIVRNPLFTRILIEDDGEGIFDRIQRLLKLYDKREALLELAKGKLTTDPARHSGEGIFFASRMVDSFYISSDGLRFTHDTEAVDRFFEGDAHQGTAVIMQLANDSPRTTEMVFDEFSAADDFTFDKTVVPVRLAQHEGEKLVSRSQAKRLLGRFEKFRTVVLDFTGVSEIGQAFADEIFRVFALTTPQVTLIPMNTTAQIEQMISRAQKSNVG